jgi:predicted dienelactone hydrolase
LKDDRVKAVFAINPLDSTVFGRQGLSQIHVPLMMLAGTNDYFAPPFSEQIYPFTWLTTPHKYLVVMTNGTHFSTLGGTGRGGALPVPQELVGPDAALAHPSIGALSTAFFKAYLTDRPEYLPYLSQSYVQSLIQTPFSYSIIDSLTAAQLEVSVPSKGSK